MTEPQKTGDDFFLNRIASIAYSFENRNECEKAMDCYRKWAGCEPLLPLPDQGVEAYYPFSRQDNNGGVMELLIFWKPGYSNSETAYVEVAEQEFDEARKYYQQKGCLEEGPSTDPVLEEGRKPATRSIFTHSSGFRGGVIINPPFPLIAPRTPQWHAGRAKYARPLVGVLAGLALWPVAKGLLHLFNKARK